MMEFMQINLNHCDIAQQLLWQTTVEQTCDVALIAEPYHVIKNDNWVADNAGIAAIAVMGRYPIQKVISRAHDGFVIAKINGVFVCSCYAPPRWTIQEFDQMLDKLTDELLTCKPLILGGDFNAWAVDWGSRVTNNRGFSLLEALAKLDVTLMNKGSVSTFRRNGRESIIDITFCSPALAVGSHWRVSEDYTHSDHQAIRYSLGKPVISPCRVKQSRERKWKIKHFDEELFLEALRNDNRTGLSAMEVSDELARACDVTMPRKLEPRNRRRQVYWWNAEISALRARCLRARRQMQRAGNDVVREERRLLFNQAKSSLKREIRRSKRHCYQKLCEDADANPWGDAYKIAMARLGGSIMPSESSPEKMKSIIEALFPQHEYTAWPPTPYATTTDERIPISNLELVEAAGRLSTKKAPGPDGIPNIALKAAIRAVPDMFREALQKCMDEGIFPIQWKRQKLVLLPKPGKPPGEASSYRPICLLDGLGKLLERMILNRLVKFSESENGLSNLQCGFRKGRSTIDAIERVIERARKALNQKLRGNRFCAVVTLDVKNAFNNASWLAIATALHRLRVPDYLCKILQSYFEDRMLTYQTDGGLMAAQITAGVPQGSILGPTLWNIMYDGVLRLKLPVGAEIIGFADDIILTVLGESLEEAEMLASEAVDTVEQWMREAKLQLAHQKTELLMVSNCKKVQKATIRAGEQSISSKRDIKYLGVLIDDRLNFKSHVDYACEKAARAIANISWIMPNSFGPRSSKRRLLATVCTSVLRYGGPAWVPALQVKRNLKLLNKTFRVAAIRVASAYRTISLDAVCVIAGMVPIGIIILEDNECYRQATLTGHRAISTRRAARLESIQKWQQEWDNSPNGRWTHSLIPDIQTWINRKHGEVNFHLTQFLSGHGCFRKYLHKIGYAESPFCPACNEVEETPEHVVFECPRFHMERGDTIPRLSVNDIVEQMCSDLSTWNSVSSAVSQIVMALQTRWRVDQNTQQIGT